MAVLEPDDRSTLIEALEPPPGMHLDAAIGTTFSLDLDAMLLVPAAFARSTLLADAALERLESREPAALLDAVWRASERLLVFCQAGAIHMPARLRPIFQWIENSVIEARSPKGGIFHPKLWVLRFADHDDRYALRILCLSRNLTHDRSWDLALRLDAPPIDRAKVRSETVNGRSLAAFIRALGEECAVRPLANDQAELVASLAEDALSARFTSPDGMSLHRFWPLGVDGGKVPKMGGATTRALVCSPFLSASTLEDIARAGTSNVLISRAEEIDRVGAAALAAFADTFVLNPDAQAPPADDEGLAGSLTGLHAKAYVLEAGPDTRLLVGSANATAWAFHRNVEFLCELRGPTEMIGVDALLATREGQVGLAALLQAHQPSTHAPGDEDALEGDLSAYGLAACPWTVRVTDVTDGRASLEISVADAQDTVGAHDRVMCQPLLVTERWRPIDRSTWTAGPFRIEDSSISSFVAVRLERQSGRGQSTTDFVVNASLIGAPDNRRECLLATLIQDEAAFIEYLLLALSGDPATGPEGENGVFWREMEAALGAGTLDGAPLLEVLLQTLSRRPNDLDHIAELVARLQATEAGRAILPDQFTEVWGTITAARTKAPK